MTPECQEVRALLSPSLDAALPPIQDARLGQHLAGCEECRAARARLEETVRLLRTTALAPVSTDFVSRLESRLARESTPSGRQRAQSDTLSREEVLEASAPTQVLLDRAEARSRLRWGLEVLVLVTSLGTATYLFLEALERRAATRTAGGPSVPIEGLLPVAPPPAPPTPTPAPTPAPIPVPDPDTDAPPLPELTPEEIAKLLGERLPAPTPKPDAPAPNVPTPPEPPVVAQNPTPAPGPGTMQKDPAREPAVAKAPPAQDADVTRILALIFRDPQTPPARRVEMIASLSDLPHRRVYEALGQVLAGALDARPLARECRGAAYEALGKLGTEDAVKVLLAVREPDRTRLLLALSSVRDGKAVAVIAQHVGDHPDRELRILLARALGRAGHRAAVPALALVLLDKKQEPLVRVECALALGAIGDAIAVRPLARILAGGAREGIVRAAAARALGQLGLSVEDAANALVDPLAKDKDPLVRENAALALGRSRRPSVAVKPLVERLDPEREKARPVRTAAAEALLDLTGKQRTPDEWRRAVEKKEALVARPEGALALAADWTSLLASGSGTVVLLDRSGSMGERDKMALAKRTAVGLVERLPETAKDRGARLFQVVCFADAPTAFFPELVVPTPDRVEQARAGIGRQQPYWAPTDLRRALLGAIRFSGVDSLVLLTDGAPTLGVTDPEQILLEIAREAGERGIRIHVVALEDGTSPFELDTRRDPPAGESAEFRFLRRLAHDTGGLFVKN